MAWKEIPPAQGFHVGHANTVGELIALTDDPDSWRETDLLESQTTLSQNTFLGISASRRSVIQIFQSLGIALTLAKNRRFA